MGFQYDYKQIFAQAYVYWIATGAPKYVDWVIDECKSKIYFLDGSPNGQVKIVYADNIGEDIEYIKNYKIHRDNGYATLINGYEHHFIEGKYLTPDQFEQWWLKQIG